MRFILYSRRGAPGARGPQGEQGSTGPAGAQGEQGPTGADAPDYVPTEVITGSANLDLAAHNGKTLKTTGASPTITVRTNATHAIPANKTFLGFHAGTGDLTIAAVSGVAIETSAGYALKVPPKGYWGLRKDDTTQDKWWLFGERVPG